MKKGMSLVLALVMCLSLSACGQSDACNCDCAQCAQCEKKTQNTVAVDADQVDNISEEAEQNENVIEFETPIVVAEDEYLRVEVVKFYEEYRHWKQGYPHIADAVTEGATLEKFVVFKLCNKTDHTLTTYLNDIYLGSDGAGFFDIDGASRIDTAAGKNVLRVFLIQTGSNEPLASMEELYSLDGDFSIFHKGEDGVMRNNYRLKFSIPDGYNHANKNEALAAGNPDGWKLFRDYLKERGPVIVTDDTTDGQKVTTIEENAGTIQISSAGESTIVNEKIRFHMLVTTQFELPSNAKTVNVQDTYLEEGFDENGNRRDKSGSTSHTWDIQNYQKSDEISYIMDYSELDTKGNYVQKTGTMTVTGAYARIVEILSQTLSESGLDVTMADLGFTSY